MSLEIYRCSHCGNIITYLTNKGVPVMCCGQKMEKLSANTVDAATEKHVPYVTIEGNKVNVKIGEVTHPMLLEHHIEWIILKTNKTVSIAHLSVGEAPEATFLLTEGEIVEEVYEYCNLHGLWKK